MSHRALPGNRPGGINLGIGGAINENRSRHQRRGDGEAARRYAYVSEILRQNIRKTTPRVLRRIIDDVARTIRDSAPPTWSILCDWHRTFISSGGDVQALIPMSWRRNRKGMRRPEVAGIVEDVFLRAYLRPERPRITEVWRIVAHRIMEANCLKAGDDKLRIPSYAAVRREVGRIVMRKGLPSYRQEGIVSRRRKIVAEKAAQARTWCEEGPSGTREAHGPGEDGERVRMAWWSR